MKRHLPIVAIFVGLLALVQAVLISRAAVPAQDAVRYVAMAQLIEARGLLASLPQLPEQPLFPILTWLTRRAVTVIWPDCSWALTVQLAAAWPLVLCAIPVFTTLRRWLGEAGAIAGTLLFCSLGEVARLGVDGLSDSTHLLCFNCCLCGISVSQVGSRTSAVSLGCAGVAAGLALLTRVESIILLPALALTAALTSWCVVASGRVASGAGAFVLGLAVSLSPFAAALGPQPAIARLSGRQGPAIGQTLNTTGLAISHQQPAAQPLVESGEPWTFTKKEATVTSRFKGYSAAIAELGRELSRTVNYMVGGLAIAGLWIRRRSLIAFDFLGVVFCLLLLVTATMYAARVGYLSSRHLLLITPFAAGWAATGALHLGQRLAVRFSELRLATGSRAHWRPTVAWSVVALASLIGVFRLAGPLHSSRWGHRQAASYLAAAGSAESVLDTRGWTGLYTMRPTYRLDAGDQALANPHLAWLVVERVEMEFDSPRGRTLRRLADRCGSLVHVFRSPGEHDWRDDVLVYRFRSPAALAISRRDDGLTHGAPSTTSWR